MNIYIVTLLTTPIKEANTQNISLTIRSSNNNIKLVCANSVEEACSKIRENWECIKNEYIALETGEELKDIHSISLRDINIIY